MNEGKINNHESKSNPYQMYQDMLDRYLKSELEKRAETAIPKTQRNLEKLGDYGYKMEINPQKEIPASSLIEPGHLKDSRRTIVTEYFFDFDDTIFNTTEYEAAIRIKLEACGISEDITKKLYEESKIAEPETGKKFHKRELYITALKKQFPDKIVDIDAIFSNVKPKDFLNEDIARLLRVITASSASRVHILTYGEINFQRSKVEAVLPELGMPIDILYTQIPKAEFLDKYLKNENSYLQTENTNVQNFVMIDDNPEELKSLVEFSKKQAFFLPIRLRKPTAKRSNIEQGDEKAYEITNNYALTLLEVKKALYDVRHGEKISAKEWQEKNVVETIQSKLDKLIESPNEQILKIERAAKGTLLITKRVRQQKENGEQFEDITKEIGFDEKNNIIYETTTNTNHMMWIDGKQIEGEARYLFGNEDYFEGES